MNLETAPGFHDQGRLEDAERAYLARLARSPREVDALMSLGIVLAQLGRLGESIDRLREAARIAPHSQHILVNLAGVLGKAGRHAEAAETFGELLRHRPNDPEGHENLAVALEHLGRLEEAEAAHRNALRLRPGFAHAHCNLGNVLCKQGRIEPALVEYRQAAALDHPLALRNMACVLGSLAQSEEASTCFHRFAALRPDDPQAGSAVLVSLLNLDDVSPDRLFAEHLGWAKRFAVALYPVDYSGRPRIHDLGISTGASTPVQIADDLPDGHGTARRAAKPASGDETIRPSDGCRTMAPFDAPVRGVPKRLRIGYVSPDFREYPAARFFLPVLENHDSGRFKLFCYSDAGSPDAVTERIRSLVPGWRDINGLADRRVDEMIRGDGIDILVDLAGHLSNPRLLLFARKPAPVQVAYIGYPNTTGLRTMDYRFTDAWHDPPGETDRYHTERLIRLPRCCWAYTPGEDLPPVAPLPADAVGGITFGVMNRLEKVTPRMIGLWAQILARTPGARLLVLGPQERDAEPLVTKVFTNRGIDPGTLHIVSRRPRREFLELFGQVDIALDTFPYAGMTTTCDAMWMGVPTVTLAGKTHVSRTGVSLMNAIGLPELIAETPDRYVSIAVALAGDIPRLRHLRSAMRERVEHSPLADGAGLAAAIESGYQQMWRRYHSDPATSAGKPSQHPS